MTSPQPPNNGDGQYTPGTIPNPFSLNQVEGAGVPTPQQVGGAIGSMITGAIGLKAGGINIFLNTLFYGMVTAIGLWFLYSGLKMIVTEVPGATGARDVLTKPFKAVGLAGIGSGFALQRGLSHGAGLDKLVGGGIKSGTHGVGNKLLSAAAP